MTDEDQIRQIVQSVIRQHHWADDDVQKALIEVARQHIWKQGLWARLKFVVNVVGFIGVLGGALMAILALLGLDVVRR
jgi:hypothetical protein